MSGKIITPEQFRREQQRKAQASPDRSVERGVEGLQGRAAPVGQIRVPLIQPPPALQADLQANPDIAPLFFQRIGATLTMALQDPQLRPRVISGDLLKSWVQLCYDVLVTMRRDMHYPLRKCFDVLPQIFRDALLRGIRAEDVAEKEHADRYWQRDKSRVPMRIHDTDLAEEAKDAGATIKDFTDEG